MFNRYQRTAAITLIRRETHRIMRLWTQTVFPPAIMMTLYFLIFGTLIGPRIGTIETVPYMQFLAPGLIMMPMITNAYSNVASSFYLGKFQGNLQELLVSPISNFSMLIGYIIGGIMRGILVAIVVSIIAMLFTHIHILHLWILIGTVILATTLFSLAGMINAMLATSFDNIMLIPTFVLTPLAYLGGVFYSLKMLPPMWHTVSLFNPILYMVNALRYSMLGVTDVGITHAFEIMLLFVFILGGIALTMLNKGVGIRS